MERSSEELYKRETLLGRREQKQEVILAKRQTHHFALVDSDFALVDSRVHQADGQVVLIASS